MQNLMKELKDILQKDDRFFKEDALFKNVVIEYALKLDKVFYKENDL